MVSQGFLDCVLCVYFLYTWTKRISRQLFTKRLLLREEKVVVCVYIFHMLSTKYINFFHSTKFILKYFHKNLSNLAL